MVDWQGVTNFDKSAQNYFGRILLPKKGGHDGEAGDEGERAGCGAMIKTPDKPVRGTGWPGERGMMVPGCRVRAEGPSCLLVSMLLAS